MNAKARSTESADEVAEQPPVAPAVVGPCLVTIVCSGPATVVVETIKDRERHPNGAFQLEANMTGHYVVTEGQSLRIVNGH